MDVARRFLFQVRCLFYLVTPGEVFKDASVAEDLANEATPALMTFLAIEQFYFLYCQRERYMTFDFFTSVTQGMLAQLVRCVTGFFEVGLFISVYETWHLFDFQFNSWLHWIYVMVALDFLYYWYHRAAHEVHLFWALHQPHHSSEDFNLSVALRISCLQDTLQGALFYLPLAVLGVPPKMFFVHKTLNLLFQFWVHTEQIPKLGPLEYIFMTPSNHRVHHARNPKYIDKNYGSVFIIWDRMFATYQVEEEKPIYGLTTPIRTNDTLYVVGFVLKNILDSIFSVSGFWNKLKVVFYGPGWRPGLPRLGDPNEIPEVDPNEIRFNPQLSTFWTRYIWVQFTVITLGYLITVVYYKDMPSWLLWVSFFYFLGAFTTLGAIIDKRPYALQLEVVRCLFYFTMQPFLAEVYLKKSPGPASQYLIVIAQLIVGISAVICCINIANGSKLKKEE